MTETTTTSEAKAKNPMPRNVLVGDNPIDTMMNCAAVLLYLDGHNPDDELDYSVSEFNLGRTLLNRTLIDALQAHQHDGR